VGLSENQTALGGVMSDIKKIDDLVTDLKRIRKEVEIVKEELDTQRKSRTSSVPPPFTTFKKKSK
jgi:hypothetical protein